LRGIGEPDRYEGFYERCGRNHRSCKWRVTRSHTSDQELSKLYVLKNEWVGVIGVGALICGEVARSESPKAFVPSARCGRLRPDHHGSGLGVLSSARGSKCWREGCVEFEDAVDNTRVSGTVTGVMFEAELVS
jgi:hypothetical protein